MKPIDCTEWYRRRDARSKLMVPDWDHNAHALLVIGDEARNSRPLQAAALIGAAILSRFVRRVTISGPNGAFLFPWPSTHLLEGLRQEMARADPCGMFSIEAEDHKQWDEGPVVVLGADSKIAGATRIAPSPTGAWIVPPGAGESPPAQGSQIGGLLAGCLAAQEVFRQLAGLQKTRAPRPYHFQVLDKPAPLGFLDFGNVQLVGVGGVGSNLAYMLPLLDARAHLDLIDPQTVDGTNLNRCLPFGFDDYFHNRAKVNVGADYLQARGILAIPHQTTYSRFVAENGRGNPDVILMMANEDQVWNTVQNNYPPVVYTAATSPNWGIHASRHRPLQEGCVACLMGQHPQDPIKLLCDESEIRRDSGTVLGVLPFLAPTAAVLTLAQVLNDKGQDVAAQNLWTTTLGTAFPRVIRTKLSRVESCICATQDQDLYRHLASRTHA